MSVIVPAYNQATFLSEALDSVLSQTYPRLEVIVVNDASPDETDEVVARVKDTRLRYVRHDSNLGLSAARNTGFRLARGELLALLDSDDAFLPTKLQEHVTLMESRADVGLTYNARFELNHSASTIREIWRPPTTVTVRDLVSGFPFSPSDVVVRRSWLDRAGEFDPTMGSAEDTDWPCRLALAGCVFAGIDRPLNYRRYHAGRRRVNLAKRRQDIGRSIDAVLSDSRCPPDVRALGRAVLTNHLLPLAALALAQEESPLAEALLLELVEANPTVLQGDPAELVRYLTVFSVADERENHEALIARLFAQLPKALRSISGQSNWAVARGYLWKATRAALWGRLDVARASIGRAAALRATIDDQFLGFLTSHLLNYEVASGASLGLAALQRVADCLRTCDPTSARHLEGSYLVNQAFMRDRVESRPDTARLLVKAICKNPAYLANRGVASVLARSVISALPGSSRTVRT
ncbi:MAG: glycosyltransferase family A protein [Vicinamibacterales bacterium]